jgi:REP element-mobilizing transposase RayT
MPRKLRVQYAGAIYHLMNRGDRREPVFLDDQDRRRFLETLAEACQKTGWQVHAYCLMPNHFHLVVETPGANLVAGMKWLMGTYTARFNRRHQYSGHLFSGRYKALIVDGSGDGYLKTVCDYVHLNPVRAKLLKREQPVQAYPWSSWPEYLKPPKRRFPWLRLDRLQGEYDVQKDTPAGRRRMEESLESRRYAGDGDEYQAIRRGWFLGRAERKAEVTRQMAGLAGENHYAEERRAGGEAVARRIIQDRLARAGCTLQALRARPKGDKLKVELAERLRAETTLSLKWLAQELGMGSWTYVSNLLSARRNKK